MATNGGGKTYVVQLGDVNGLTSALLQIFQRGAGHQQQQFAVSVSLPASANAQGQFPQPGLRRVVFRPDATAAPRWQGNLKRYQIGYDASGNIVLQDAKGNAAISNASTGFISPNAVSFWTSEPPLSFGATGYGASAVASWPAPAGYWRRTALVDESGGALIPLMGKVVEKAARARCCAHRLLTSQTGRQLITCNGAGSCPTSAAMPSFDSSNTWLKDTRVRPAALRVINSGDERREDHHRHRIAQAHRVGTRPGRRRLRIPPAWPAPKAEPGPGTPVTVRSSIHADVLHSRPAVINLWRQQGVVVFYGINDGVFHAINGNQTQGIGSVRPGGEPMGFHRAGVPWQAQPPLHQLSEVKLSTTPGGITPLRHREITSSTEVPP
ncbi:hypothetical protein ACU4GD_16930 [Cupriavidus basilensis]